MAFELMDRKIFSCSGLICIAQILEGGSTCEFVRENQIFSENNRSIDSTTLQVVFVCICGSGFTLPIEFLLLSIYYYSSRSRACPGMHGTCWIVEVIRRLQITV